MLPIDIPSEDIIAVLRGHGAEPDGIDAAFMADIDEGKHYGQTWLALDMGRKRLYRFSADGKYFDVFDTSEIKSIYMESFVTTARLLAVLAPSSSAAAAESGRGDELSGADGVTVVLCGCTNTHRDKMSAFLGVWDRLSSGAEVNSDDVMFSGLDAKCPKCGRLYSDPELKVCDYCVDKMGLLRRIFSYFKPFRMQFAMVMACLVTTSVLSIISPFISGEILFDQVVSAPTFASDGTQLTGRFHSIEYVYVFSGLLIVLALISLFTGIAQNRFNAHVSQWVGHNMRMELFSSLQKLSYSYFNKNSAGGMFSKVNYDTDVVKSFYIDGVPYLLMNGINFIGVTAFMLYLNFKLTLILFIPVAVLFFYFRRFLPEFYRSQGQCWRARHSMNVMLGDTLNGMRVVKAFSREEDETSRFNKKVGSVFRADNYSAFMSLLIGPGALLIIGLASQAVWGVGGVEVMSRHMTYGELTAYLGYLGMMLGPLSFFSTFALMVTDTVNSAVRIFDILDTVPEITEAPDAVSQEHFDGRIKFDSVCFHYENNRPVLRDVSFEIKPGDRVGIVGHTGGGKSTIVNLITRMYDVTSGSVQIDGYNVKDLSFGSLRRNVAIVSQEIYIFSGTIADNISFARPGASKEEIIAAARAANAHDFIMRLSDGYETYVGEGNVALSGGERQRISIARALLADSSVLIFDEATAAMDTQTEKLIGDAMERLTAGKTTIMIAHRLSTLSGCDYIMAIENGEVAELGTAEELLARKGVYYRLHTLQNEQLHKVMQGI